MNKGKRQHKESIYIYTDAVKMVGRDTSEGPLHSRNDNSTVEAVYSLSIENEGR